MNKNIVFCCIVFVLISISVGCSNPIKNDLSQIRIANTSGDISDKSEENRSSEIKSEILKLGKINDASVVIDGHTALIGIEVKSSNPEETRKIKEQVTNIVREKDLYIEGIAITSNENIIHMIKNLEHTKEDKIF